LAEALGLLIDGAIVTAHATRSTAPARSAAVAASALLRLAAS
jgi:hypothetical protein